MTIVAGEPETASESTMNQYFMTAEEEDIRFQL